jgi:hypothetical protein
MRSKVTCHHDITKFSQIDSPVFEALEPRLLLSGSSLLDELVVLASGEPVADIVMPADAGDPAIGVAGGDDDPGVGAGAVVIADVPAYYWRHGCAPTGGGMIIGYWDGQGFSNLVEGDASSQTAAANQMIASTEHYNDYALPKDSGSVIADKSTTGGAHENNSVADWMRTSWSARGNTYGSTRYSNIDDGLEGYARAMGYEEADAWNESWGSFTWDDYVTEIEAGRPIGLLVDSNGNGSVDHFVAGVGYNEATMQYAAYNTWDYSLHWYNFAPVSSSQSWGIYGATFFDPGTPPTDTVAPTAQLSAANVTANAATYEFTITFTDNDAVDVSDLDSNDIRITGPNGFDQTATFIGVDIDSDGATRTATYRIVAPDGMWDDGDNGTYTVSIEQGQVSDVSGNTVVPTVLGTFEVAVADTTGARVTSSNASGSVAGQIDRVRFTFSEEIADGSFDLSDIASFTGPTGSLTATGVNKISSTEYEVTFAPQTALGEYALTVGPDILDLSGNTMDQNTDGLNGQGAADQFTTSFALTADSFDARFDFGTDSSPLEAGHTNVTHATLYSAGTGYGWQSAASGSIDRATGNDLERDLVYTTSSSTFLVDAPNGTYTVSITLGDIYDRPSMRVYLEGVLVDTVSTTAGNPVTKSYEVTVTDGQLTFTLEKADPVRSPTLNGLTMTAAGVTPTLAVSLDSATISETDGAAAARGTVTRTGNTTGDLMITLISSDTSEAAVPITVTILDGQTSATFDLAAVDDALVDGTQTVTITATAAGYDAATAELSVLDDDLALQTARFDFGTDSSPLEAGHTNVTHATLYSAGTGYGWQSAASGSIDRATGNDLERDLVYTTSSSTFLVDAPNGTYTVSITLGDIYDRPSMRVYLEGVLVDTVSTTAGNPVTKSYEVTVTDGQLTFTLEKADPVRSPTLNGLTMTAAGVTPTLAVSLDSATISETDGAAAARGTVTRTGNTTGDLMITLISSDTSEAAVPITVTILDGQTSATFDLAAVDDALVDGTQTVTITATAAGYDAATAELSVLDDDLALQTARFDFGTDSSPLESGFTRVTDTTQYSDALGYGWESLPSGIYHGSLDRETGTALTQDLVYGNQGTFGVQIDEAGNYGVTLVIGDMGGNFHDQVGIYIEGQLVDTITTAAGEVLTKYYEADVSDGRLSIEFRDLGGSDTCFAVEAVEVTSL